jgi:hypothetical protein
MLIPHAISAWKQEHFEALPSTCFALQLSLSCKYSAQLLVTRKLGYFNEQLEQLKQERDKERLAEQEENLFRQYDRWKVPTRLRTSQQIRSDPEARKVGYARHALRTSLNQVCFLHKCHIHASRSTLEDRNPCEKPFRMQSSIVYSQ